MEKGPKNLFWIWINAVDVYQVILHDEKEEEKPFGGSPTSGEGSSSYFPILRKLIDFG